uniref:Uncharacterized protein n=1 Tax=Anguilla anguilla TaxID=7936 RepID=A0A0E9PR98_ANGAN
MERPVARWSCGLWQL